MAPGRAPGQCSAAQAGDAGALERAAEQLQAAGLDDEAVAFFLRAAENGRIRAFKRATELLKSKDRPAEAAQLDRLGVKPGGSPAGRWELSEIVA